MNSGNKASDMPRCHYGKYFTLAAVIYGIVMIFMFGRHFQSSITVFQVKSEDGLLAKGDPLTDQESLPVDNPAIRDFQVKTAEESEDAANEVEGPIKTTPKEKKKKIILLTYMRSGSSLTGDLLQQHPDVFYIYEPLWQTQHNYLDGISTKYLDGRVIEEMDPEEYWAPYSMSVQVMKTIGTCQFQLLDIASLKQPHLFSSKSTKPYAQCRRTNTVSKKMNDTASIELCIDHLKNPCENAKVIVSKVIRFTFAQVQFLLTIDPDVKVIYLLRDPRGSLLSQHRTGQFKWNPKDLRNTSWHFCDRVFKDLILAKSLTQVYPDQILTVRYEDLAEHPTAATEFIYNWIGIDMNDRIRQYIHNITQAGKPANCAICTTRSNSTETAHKWRDHMTFENATIIQNMCYRVFKVMGYRKFEGKYEMKNRKHLSMLKDFNEDLNAIRHDQLEAMATNKKDTKV